MPLLPIVCVCEDVLCLDGCVITSTLGESTFRIADTFCVIFHVSGLIGSINILVEQEERFEDTKESDEEMYSLIGETKYGKSLHHLKN